MCGIGLNLFYGNIKSEALKPIALTMKKHGLIQDLNSESRVLEGYLYVFLKYWNKELEPTGEFSWKVISHRTMLAVIFTTENKGEYEFEENETLTWHKVLKKLETDLLVPYNSNRIYIDGMVRFLTDTNIIIIKRNEKRLWTRSKAREDAEALLVQAMHQEQIENE